MKQQLLLLEDVDGLGRSGDVVTAKPGFIRNFLLPQKKAVIADKQTLKMQARLKEEREKRAIVDRKEAEELAATLVNYVLETEVKVDPEGKMYGSVSTLDIARMLQAKGYAFERKNISLLQPIRTLGTHIINLKLKEGVQAKFTLEVLPEGGPLPLKKEEEVMPSAETPPESGG
jgi:large subunit ribosomal protein L9